MPAPRFERTKIALLMIVFTALVGAGIYYALTSDPQREADRIREELMAKFEADEAAREREREAAGGTIAATPTPAPTPRVVIPTTTPPTAPAFTPPPATPTPAPTQTAAPTPATTPAPDATPTPSPTPLEPLGPMLSATLNAAGAPPVDRAFVAVTKPDDSQPTGAAILDWSEVPVSPGDAADVYRVGPLETPPQPLYAVIATDREGGVYFAQRAVSETVFDSEGMEIDLGQLTRNAPTMLHLEIEGEGPDASHFDILLHRPDGAIEGELASDLEEAAFLLTSPHTLGTYAGYSPARGERESVTVLGPLYPDADVTLEVRPAGSPGGESARTSVPLVPYGVQYMTVDLDNLFVSKQLAWADIELRIVDHINGYGVAGATVRFADGSSRQQWQSDESGLIVIPELKVGEVRSMMLLAPGAQSDEGAVKFALAPARTPLIDKSSPPNAEGLRLPATENDIAVWQQTVVLTVD